MKELEEECKRSSPQMPKPGDMHENLAKIVDQSPKKGETGGGSQGRLALKKSSKPKSLAIKSMKKEEEQFKNTVK